MNGSKVDLRSDTVTRPTRPMRDAIASAIVGDDAFGDDPTVSALESRTAELLGKEASVLFPSGVMANEVALALAAPRGSEAIVEATSHFFDWELAAPAALSGVQLRPIAGPGGMLDADLVRDAIRPPGTFYIRSSLVCLENTHNAAGGRVMPLDTMRAIRKVAAEYGLPVHLDGARLWNAAVATGTTERDFADTADTVMVTLSKGLGCPVGSMLAGSAEAMQEARRLRRRFGGTMRQAGILAAAGLYALDHNRERLADDHRRAARLAELTGDIDGLDVVEPETNIVMFDIRRPDMDAEQLTSRLADRDVLLTVFTRTRIRATTHLGVDDHAIEAAAHAIADAMTN
jgi:threonine aldolase